MYLIRQSSFVKLSGNQTEISLTAAEVILAAELIAAPGTAFVIAPLELVLGATSAGLIDVEIAYWSYTTRVAITPADEPVQFEWLPPWGFGKE